MCCRDNSLSVLPISFSARHFSLTPDREFADNMEYFSSVIPELFSIMRGLSSDMLISVMFEEGLLSTLHNIVQLWLSCGSISNLAIRGSSVKQI